MATLAPSSSSSSTTTLTPEEARISAELAQDRPTIDTAVKSFLSLICARGMTASSVLVTQPAAPNTDPLVGSSSSTNHHHHDGTIQPTNAQALQVARLILQACNQYRFPIHQTVAHVRGENPNLSNDKKMEFLELSVVARLWNGLIDSNQKPTRFLGRKALRHAWHDLKPKDKVPPSNENCDPELTADAIYQQQLQSALVQEFERYLFCQRPGAEEEKVNANDDNDAALIWDADGGQAELNRRRQRRQAAATQRNDNP